MRSSHWVIGIGSVLSASGVLAAEPTKQQCISANEGGQDLRRAGKLRDAIDRFAYCAVANCPGVLREDCRTRLEEARSAVPTLLFVARDRHGRVLTGVRATMDGAPLAASIDRSAIPVEPGEHTFAFSADGYQSMSRTFVIQEGISGREEVIVLEPLTSADNGASTHVIDSGMRARTPRTTDGSTTGMSQRTLAYLAGGAGIVGLGIGAAFGVLAGETYASAKEKCPQPSACTRDDAIDKRDDAGTHAAISTVAFVAGAVALAGGVVLWLTAPTRQGVSVATTGSGIRLRATW